MDNTPSSLSEETSQDSLLQQRIKAASHPHLPWWKWLLLLVLMTAIGFALYYAYLGYIIEVLTVLTILFVTVGVLLVVVYLISQELFLWLIGKRSEYQKMIEASRMAAIGISRAAIQFTPAGLTQEEKERLKSDVPTLLHMRFMSGINNFIARIFIGAFAAAFGLLGTIVLMKQNEKLDIQNEKLDYQVYLEESNRRSTLIIMMSNIMDKVDEELKECDKLDKPRRLSQQLVGRIAALSQSFKPYRFLEGDTLIAEEYSPERGQLLLAIANSGIDSIGLDEIYAKAIFNRAFLKNAVMDNTYLKKIRLEEAYLKNISLNYSILNEAYLNNVVLENAKLCEAELYRVKLKNANLKNADLISANFFEATLNKTDFCEAHLFATNFFGADLSHAKFQFTTFLPAIFNNAKLTKSNFNNSNIPPSELLKSKNIYGIENLPNHLKQQMQQLDSKRYKEITAKPKR